MKKLFLGIVVLGLLWCNVVVADTGVEKGFKASDLFKPEYILENYGKNILVKTYLFGLAEGMRTATYFGELFKNNSNIFCVPDKMRPSADDYFAIFKTEYFKLTETGPLSDDTQTAHILIFALEDTFPCKK